jgi:hypothetical protein
MLFCLYSIVKEGAGYIIFTEIKYFYLRLLYENNNLNLLQGRSSNANHQSDEHVQVLRAHFSCEKNKQCWRREI